MATQARLCRTWAQYAILQHAAVPSTTESFWLLDLHRILMQQITLCCLTLEPPTSGNNGGSDLEDTPTPNDDRVICDVARVVRIVFYASLLAGGCDPPAQLEREAAEAEEVLAEISAAASASSSFSSRVCFGLIWTSQDFSLYPCTFSCTGIVCAGDMAVAFPF